MSQSDLIYGRHAVQAVLTHRPGDIQELWVQDPNSRSLQPIAQQAIKQNIQIQEIDSTALREKAGDAVHQGIAARVRLRQSMPEKEWIAQLKTDVSGARLLILDGINDPRNLGACLRISEAAGIQAVITPQRKSAGLTGAVYKSASGSAERVPLVTVSNLARTLKQLKQLGVWLYAASHNGESPLWQTTFNPPWGIVVGSENTGVRSQTLGLCDVRVSIPMCGQIESLNLASACSVLLYEAKRQST